MTEIRAIGAKDYEAWDQYVLDHAAGGPYLTTAWKNAIETGYGQRTHYFGAFKSGLVGVLPLVLINPPIGRKSLVSLPYCDYGGLLATHEKDANELLQRAIELAGELRASLEIRTAESSPTLSQTDTFVQVTDKCRMLLELPDSADLLWGGFKSKLRSQISRALKNGLNFKIGKAELLRDFYEVFSRSMRDLGSPVHAETWLAGVLAAFGDGARVGVVYKDDIPTAAGIILIHGNAVTIPWASALREFNRLSPNMLLYWNLLKHACDSGSRFFDFGRSTPGEGTYKFKQQWGATPVPLHWYRSEPAGPAVSVAKNGSARAIVERVWKKLPVGVANFAGPQIRKGHFELMAPFSREPIEDSVCICILAYNEQKHIADTIHAILAASDQVSVDIIVYANGCTDKTADVVNALCRTIPNLRLRELAKASKPNAWNTAFAENTNPILFFSDGDVRPEAGSVAALLQYFDKHAEVSLVCSRIWPAPQGLRLEQHLTGFLQIPFAQDFHTGGFYAIRRSHLAARLKEKGLAGIPDGVVGEDDFLGALVNKNALMVAREKVFYTPPTFEDYWKWVARVRWQEEQLVQVYGDLISNQNPSSKGVGSSRLASKLANVQGPQQLLRGLASIGLRSVLQAAFRGRIEGCYRSLGPVGREGRNILSQATRSESAK